MSPTSPSSTNPQQTPTSLPPASMPPGTPGSQQATPRATTPLDAPSGSPAPGAGPMPHETAWRPRVDRDDEFNSFANDHRSPDIMEPSERIIDPKEDTAPLQGEGDRSDDDALTMDRPDEH